MSLKSLIRNQKPLTVSLVSFLLMLAVVVTIGLVGGRHIIDYLQEQLVEHGINHNQEVLAEMRPLLEHSFQDGVPAATITANFQEFIEHSEPFGIRLFLIDRTAGEVIADSSAREMLPYPVSRLVGGPVHQFDGSPIPDLGDWSGTGWRSSGSGTTELLSMQPLTMPERSAQQWSLGVSSDLSDLLALMDELHLHLDLVLLITYGLIGLLGFLVLRWVGRRYESGLEQQVEARTRELKQAHERLLDQARLATIGQTASVLAHEMRNPLASIKLALSAVRRSEGFSSRERQRLDLVVGEVDRLEGMLGQTLEYVHPVVRDEQPVALDALLDKVLALEEALLAEKNLRLIRSKCPRCPALRLDSEKMQQVFLNLLKNAREASPEGGEINVSLEAVDGKLVFTVSNQGKALEQEVQDHVFDFFFTTKARGTGLGLGLVKRVVEEHGGSVELGCESGIIVARIFLPAASEGHAGI